MKIQKISQRNSLFPHNLTQIYNSPKFFYLNGAIPEGFKVAIVGMRKNSPYGEKVVKDILSQFTRSNIVTISGLAYGIDTLVHKYTLEYGGKTIAVLGSGLNQIYPSTNIKLAGEILEAGGGLISEYELDEGPERWHFPARNRIVSGLCDALIVIEAAVKSGSLITAKLALEQGKDVWAVPGRIDAPTSEGTNQLISSGAIPLINSDQFLEYYKLSTGTLQKKSLNLSESAKKLYKYILKQEGLSVDKLAQASKLEISQLNIYLTELEINCLIINRNGQIYLL